jgi:hypothetical protein
VLIAWLLRWPVYEVKDKRLKRTARRNKVEYELHHISVRDSDGGIRVIAMEGHELLDALVLHADNTLTLPVPFPSDD